MAEEHIKINPVPTKVKYSGNGVVREFPTGFAFFEDDNIVVYHNGVIINTGYSVTGVGETDGGVVTFDVAPAEGDKIVIIRKVAIERVTDFQEGGAFRAKNINDELDRQTAFCQQIQEEIDRCVKVEVTDDQTPEELLTEVYGKLDSATEVAQNAVDAATAATEAVASAEKTLAEVTTYVDESKAEIGALITKTTEEIDQTISDATEEIKEVAVNSANEAVQETIGTSVIEAATSAEHARIWAEGEQAEVEPIGGSLSSMGAADLAYAIANAPEDTPIDASGLFAMNVVKGEKGDKGDKGDKGEDGKDGKIGIESFATNCITEIPQDIKLELVDGVLTLKAGSKVYALDGSSYTIPTDVTFSYSGTTAHSSWILVKENGEMFDIWTSESASNISIGSKWVTFGGTNCYLPICLATHNADGTTKTGWKSIDQVFNGFGYIGSTVFALPNVKGLIPNGRNADGSLRNIEVVTSKVATRTYNTNTDRNVFVSILENGEIGLNGSRSYDEENNYILNGVARAIAVEFAQAFFTVSNGITSFTPKLPFHAVDRNDSSWVAGQAMPSNKYIDLTLGASGTKYTALANGWVTVAKVSTGSAQIVSISSNGVVTTCYSSTSGQGLKVYAPVIKGGTFVVDYTTGGTTERFRFIYAEGEAN